MNDATRNQEFTIGSTPSDYTFGGILGTQEINTRASIYRPGNRISYAVTNTNYDHRVMATHASGMNTKGWAFVVSGGRRWAEKGYFEGTDYSANSLFASVEKKFNEHHSLNATGIWAQNSRGKNSPNTDEVTQLAGFKYNSYWGYQDGRKRNSRDKNVEEPIIMLGHYWKITDKTNLNTNVAYQLGSIGNSRLDFTGAVNSPDPSYYKYLPSYYLSQFSQDDYTDYTGDTQANLDAAAGSRFFSFPQIDWDGMYRVNSDPLRNEPGRSLYVLYEDRTDDRLFTANSIINSQLADNIVVNGGVTFRKLKSHNYQYLLDLLGGTYFKDIDSFGGTLAQEQADLNNPDRIVGEGDIYGYNYNLLANTIDAFTQFKFTYKKVDFYLGESFTRTEYQREGLYRNGYYPTNSFGKSDKYTFENFGFKGGLTYKLSGQYLFTVNSAYMTKAPALRNVFPNARINNNVISVLNDEKVVSADASFIVKMSNFKLRLTAYFSKIQDASESSFYFADGVGGEDDPDTPTNETNSFVAETVTGLDKKNIGGELGVEYQLTSTLKLTLNAAYGEYTYDNDPNVTLNVDAQATADNTNPIRDYGTAKLTGYRQPGMPQTAVSFGWEYRDPKFWWVGANANYLDNNYIDIAPITRTSNFFVDPLTQSTFPEVTEEGARALLDQEKFDPIGLINLSGGKSWKVGSKTFGFFASINNLLDKRYKTGGFEQARNANYRQLNQDVSSGNPAFGPKYFYGYGTTYFVNFYINF